MPANFADDEELAGRRRGEPIEFLPSISGDTQPGQGQEILAILEEVLFAGFVHVEPGTPEEMYVWPCFYPARSGSRDHVINAASLGEKYSISSHERGAATPTLVLPPSIDKSDDFAALQGFERAFCR